MNRLIRVEAMSQTQIRALRDLHGSFGVCACGALLTVTSAKFVLGNFLTKHPTDRNLKECVVMGAYCLGCSTRINNLLKDISSRRIN